MTEAVTKLLESALAHPSVSTLRVLRDELIWELRMEQCPTLCDYDCLDMCHEHHQIPRRRDHDPRECEMRRGLTDG